MLKLLNLSCKFHIILALIIRFVLIIYGEYQDKISEVPYTDIDYRVFTDASRHVLNSSSPYERHTYRYSPLLAIILIPNLILHPCFGKVLFSVVDIFVGLLIYSLVKNNRQNYSSVKKNDEKDQILSINDKIEHPNLRKRKKKLNEPDMNKKISKPPHDFIPTYCMCFWLYNPMSFIISTRGNCDSMAVFLVLLTLYYLQVKRNYLVAGLSHGLSVHFRLYPIIYSLTYFMYLSGFSRFDYDGQKCNDNIFKPALTDNKNSSEFNLTDFNNEKILKTKNTIFKKEYLYYLLPNKDQMKLIFGSILAVVTFTALFYVLYGYNFLYETYIYHVIRKDTRHNFSLFFYIQYLTANVKNVGIWQKVLCILPQLVLILVLSVRYGLNRFTLNFSILTQTIVMVTYNSVLTSQYFVWIFGMLPLVLWQLDISYKKGVLMFVAWFIAQLAWLLPAYLLEFLGQNTFLFIWIQSLSFFCANMAVLGRLIKCFMYKVE